MTRYPDKLRLKGQADEDQFFARNDAVLVAAIAQRRRYGPGERPRVVSGGQTGVDRGALDAALAVGLPVGGWCPAGRRAEDGVVPARYPLTETPSAEYGERTEWNVRESDATVVFYRSVLSGGTRRTVEIARRLRRPLLLRDLSNSVDPGSIASWLRRNRVQVLNCAGPRESGAPGIELQARGILEEVFRLWMEG